MSTEVKTKPISKKYYTAFEIKDPVDDTMNDQENIPSDEFEELTGLTKPRIQKFKKRKF